MADETNQEDAAKPEAAAAAQTQQPVQVQVEADHAVATYANFCRVTGSPEELIVDFGLNPQPIGVSQRSNSGQANASSSTFTPPSGCWLPCRCQWHVMNLSLVFLRLISTNEFAQVSIHRQQKRRARFAEFFRSLTTLGQSQ